MSVRASEGGRGLAAEAADGWPLITVIMPVRCEGASIQGALRSVLAQDYPPDRMEVLVVDGMSPDGTRETVLAIAEEVRARGGAPGVTLLDNPGRIVPVALNIGLRHARGDVVVRVDGHCEIASDYLRRCVEALRRTGAECVGGPMVTLGTARVARAIASAQSSHFGVGGVAFRTGAAAGRYVDTLAFGAYRREVFESLGGFDEELVRNQDDEFNFRLIQAGGRIWLDPAIRSIYHSRASLSSLWRQYFQYGLYKVRVIQKRRAVPSWRHLAPAAFVTALAASILLALAAGDGRWALAVAGPYLIANLLVSGWLGRRDPHLRLLLPLAFVTLHLSYGLGFVAGLALFRRRWGRRAP